MAELGGFGGGLLGPDAVNDISGFRSGSEKIQRNHCKLQVTAPLQKQNIVRFRDCEELSEVRPGFFMNRRIGGPAVTHFENTHPLPVKVRQFTRGFFQNLQRQHRRAR